MSPSRRQVRLWPVLVLIIASFLVWTVSWWSPLGKALESTISHRLEFLVRERFGKTPVLDERLKLFAYDDQAVEAYGTPELLPLSDWTMFLGSIAAKKPRVILIDRLFNLPHLASQEAEFFRALKTFQVPIHAASSVHPEELKGRAPIPDAYLGRFQGTVPFDVAPAPRRFAYGPSEPLFDVFTGVGHIVLEEDGFLRPVYAWDDGRFLPTLGLRAAERLDLEREGVLVEGRGVPVDGERRIPVNISARKEYGERLISMKSAIDAARRREAQAQVEPGDVVIVLPAMYTGNADIKRSPQGRIEGGLLHVAVANSVLGGRWIITFGDGRWTSLAVLLIVCLAGGMGAHFFSPRKGFFWVSAGILSIVGAGLASFVLSDVRLFWLHPALAFASSAFFVIADKAISLEMHSRRVNHALEGLVSPGLLKTLMKNPEALHLDPKEIHATVMFVDVEGFSLRAEIRRPAQVFFELKEQLSRVANIVHKHGGIIDKTLGDGLLAFFGHSYDEKEHADTHNHAYAALACAVEIQRECARVAVKLQDDADPAHARDASKAYESVLPLRIGLNSGPVYLGNLGTGLRIDFTIVGDTVNFAKRLEDAAETFRVMIGSHTRELLRVAAPVSEGGGESEFQIPPGSALRKRLLSIKHHHELIEGWECDPFAFEPEVFRAALTSARDKVSRNAQRWRVPDEVSCLVYVNRANEGRLLNFSLSGLGFEGIDYLARRVQVTVELDSPDGSLRRRLQESGLLPLVCEVRWGTVQEGVVRHGVQIMNFDAAQRELLVKLLLEDIARRYEAASS